MFDDIITNIMTGLPDFIQIEIVAHDSFIGNGGEI